MCAKDPFQRYLDLADVLGTMFASFVEVIAHDLRPPESSIIAIYNGHITVRKVGDGTTDIIFIGNAPYLNQLKLAIRNAFYLVQMADIIDLDVPLLLSDHYSTIGFEIMDAGAFSLNYTQN